LPHLKILEVPLQPLLVHSECEPLKQVSTLKIHGLLSQAVLRRSTKRLRFDGRALASPKHVTVCIHVTRRGLAAPILGKTGRLLAEDGCQPSDLVRMQSHVVSVSA
jgi:hypothetical protein